MQSFTIEEFKKIHQAWKESGLSVRDYCANTGIKESRYMIDYNPIENCNHGKTKSARIQKRNVFSTDKNEM